MTMKILKRLKKIFWSKKLPEEDLLHLSESNNENDGKGPKVKKRSASMTPEEKALLELEMVIYEKSLRLVGLA